MSVEERLEQLERKVRWMRRTGAVGVALVAAVFLMGQGKEKELPDLEVRSLTVVDEAMNKRASLGSGILSLFDIKGVERLTLGAEPCISFSDENKQERIRMSVESRASAGPRFTGVVVCDKRGTARLEAGTTDSGQPLVNLSKRSGEVIWSAPRLLRIK